MKERYGIPPKLVPDLIALRGDPSDGIPGAKGVGEKTAVELLRRHGSLEKVLAAAIREPRPALRTALTGDRDQLLAFKDVATLRTAKVSRPRDKRTDYRGAAKAARERGMNRLARAAAGEGAIGLETRSAPPGRGANGATGRRGTYMCWSVLWGRWNSPRSRPILHRPEISLGRWPPTAKGTGRLVGAIGYGTHNRRL